MGETEDIRPRVLIVEDSQHIAELERRHLERGGFDVLIAPSAARALGLIEAGEQIDLLIIDYNLPDITGVALMGRLREMGRELPSIILTAAGNEQVAVSAMKLGAMDYVVKERETIKALPETCREVLRKYNLRAENERLMRELRVVNQELVEANSRLEDLSRRDALTGIYNRRYLMEALEREVARSMRYRSPLCFAILDIDHFKRVNDTHGHIAGDRVLSQFASTVRARLRKTDVFGRYGGEEFGIVITETPLREAIGLCEELRAMVEQMGFTHDGGQVRLTASAGVAEFRREMDVTGLINLADNGLYEAKQSGRNRISAPQLAGT